MSRIKKYLGAAVIVLAMLVNHSPAFAIENADALDDSRPDMLALVQLLKDERYDDLNRVAKIQECQ